MSNVNNVVAGADEKECLSLANFKEIKNLVKYVTEDIVSLFGRLEAKVEELAEKIDILEQKNQSGKKRKEHPLFCLDIEDEEEFE